MSLYIGNLSFQTCRGELERVFQKFGRCNVQLKDGYGFVVYDSTQNAEKAMMALQGRNICGQSLTLTWSYKQPRPFKRFSKAARQYEQLHGRSSVRGEVYTNRKLRSNDRKEYKFGVKPQVGDDRRLNFVDILDREASDQHDIVKDYVQEEHFEYREDFPDEGGNVEPNLVDNDRWAGQLHDQPNGNSFDNGIELDQYDRYGCFDKRAEEENHHMAYSDGSHAPLSSQDVLRKDNLSDAPLEPPNQSKPQQTCYSCGGSDHKMRNCPKETTSQRKLTRLRHRHDDDMKRGVRANGKLEKYGSDFQMKLQPHKELSLGDEGKASSSGRHHSLMKDTWSNRAKKANRVRRKDHEGKKRKRNFGTPNKNSEKKAKISGSLSLHSYYTEFRSHSTSRSSKAVPKSGLRFRLRSVSSRSCPSTSKSRSSSIPRNSTSMHAKSRSRSNSHKSMSFYEPLPSSPDMVQTNLKTTLDNAVNSKSKEILVDQALPGDVPETAELENNKVVKTDSSYKLENDMDKNHPIHRDWTDNFISHAIANQSTQQSEKATLTALSLPSETLKEAGQLQNPDASAFMHKPPPIEKSTSEAHVSLHSAHSTSISPEEMCMVMKHYGRKLDDENERNLPPDAYFGSARLWPWEIIYYRRLKKGPITTENYARRVAQNQEFGIVDKYVRSSTGWEELGHYHS